MKRFSVVCCCLLAGALYAETPIHRLSGFGKTDTVAGAKAAVKQAAATLKAGGIVVVDDDVAADFAPESQPQKDVGTPGVFLLDIRQGKLRLVPPALGFRIPQDPIGYSSFFLDRTINQGAMNAMGLNSIVRISDRILKGTTSYFQYVVKTEKTDDPQTIKIYVPTIKGLYVGLELTVQSGAESVAYSEKRYTAQFPAVVEKIGLDNAVDHWIVVRKNNPKTPWGEVVSLFNKASTNSVTINEVTHGDQENAGTISIEKHAYGQGDNFGVGMTYIYMGNVMSTRSDECGNGYTVNIWQHLSSFLGKVEKYDAENGELHYDANAVNSSTLGTSRALINLNPKKWITAGKIAIEANYSEYGEVDPAGFVRGIGTNWTPAVAGRYIAVNQEDEYAGNPPKGFWKDSLKGRKIRRWWYIRKYEKINGEDRLWVERTRYTVFDNATPTLINPENYRKELSYIIAPGAMVADVSQAIPEINRPYYKGAGIKPGSSRIILLAPGKDGADTFAAGDAVEQAVGSDPAHPNGYRVRHRETMPTGTGNSCSFYTTNNGAYPIRAALGVYGGHDQMQLPNHSKFFNVIDVGTSCDYGIRFRNTVRNAALYMEKMDHKIAWKTPIGNVELSALENALKLNDSGLAGVKGISATNQSANNLRGVDIKVPANLKKFEFKFATPEPDANYSLTVQPNWLCRWAVNVKTPQGFTVVFDEASSAQSTLDWQLIR